MLFVAPYLELQSFYPDHLLIEYLRNIQNIEHPGDNFPEGFASQIHKHYSKCEQALFHTNLKKRWR